LGDEPENVKDISNLFINENQYLLFYNVNNLCRVVSVIIVNNRTSKINDCFIIPACILYLYYNYDITYKFNYRKRLYPYFQIILCMYLTIILYKTITF